MLESEVKKLVAANEVMSTALYFTSDDEFPISNSQVTSPHRNFSTHCAACYPPAMSITAMNVASSPFHIHGLDHVQLAMPLGAEDRARQFYVELLGLRETQKPANLAARGGVWFEGGSLRLHMGVDADFHPARKAHPALLVENLDALTAHLERSGVKVIHDEPLEGYRRVYVSDPFGNRIELLEPAF